MMTICVGVVSLGGHRVTDEEADTILLRVDQIAWIAEKHLRIDLVNGTTIGVRKQDWLIVDQAFKAQYPVRA